METVRHFVNKLYEHNVLLYLRGKTRIPYSIISKRKAVLFSIISRVWKCERKVKEIFFNSREKVCCGTIFKGPNGELLLDPSFLKPCRGRIAASCRLVPVANGRVESTTQNVESSTNSPTSEIKVEIDISESTVTKLYSDSSSDSGYDDSSNQGVIYSALKKPEEVSSTSGLTRNGGAVASVISEVRNSEIFVSN